MLITLFLSNHDWSSRFKCIWLTLQEGSTTPKKGRQHHATERQSSAIAKERGNSAHTLRRKREHLQCREARKATLTKRGWKAAQHTRGAESINAQKERRSCFLFSGPHGVVLSPLFSRGVAFPPLHGVVLPSPPLVWCCVPLSSSVWCYVHSFVRRFRIPSFSAVRLCSSPLLVGGVFSLHSLGGVALHSFWKVFLSSLSSLKKIET